MMDLSVMNDLIQFIKEQVDGKKSIDDFSVEFRNGQLFVIFYDDMVSKIGALALKNNKDSAIYDIYSYLELNFK